MSLVLEQVSAGYAGTVVLNEVELVVPAGRVVALIGPNGAGKTTLLRTCAGLLRPRRGRVVLDGIDVGAERPYQLLARGLCLIPEGRGIFPSLTVRENLRLFRRGASEEALARATEAFPVLGDRLWQVAGTLSGGEQQMLALARAYATSPRYVLLDEVSMGLAPSVIDKIFEFLQRLASEGVALLLVEQYIPRALAMADLVYVLRKGRVTFAGEPVEVDGDRLAREYLGGASASTSTVGREE